LLTPEKLGPMRKHLLLVLSVFFAAQSFAQFRLGIFGGVSNYHGDLQERVFQNARGAFGLTGTFSLSERLNLRAGLTFAKLAGADSLSKQADLRARNLSFQSSITEFSLLAEYNFFNLDQIRWTPYVFGGLAVFHYNPYTFDRNGAQVYLQPLGTEGQGITGYGQPYKLTQFAIPFGGGIKYVLSDRVQLGLEAGIRKTFTDYLDDVSGNYADFNELFNARGQRAVDLAYRGDERAGGDPLYPAKGTTRGGAKFKDYYYFTGLHVSFQLGNGEGGRDRKSGYGCPTVF
jgi:hypothetical protein